MAVASVGVHLIAPYLDNQPYQELGLNHYLAALPVRPVFALFILGVDVWLGLRWFRDRPTATHPTFWEETRTAFEETHGVQSEIRSPWSPFGSLVWQTARQSWKLLAAISGLYVLGNLLALPLLLAAPSASPGEPYLAPLGWLLGGCVFLADQRNAGFRFLAERGVRPRWVWASRQIVWFGFFLFWAVLTAIFFLVFIAEDTTLLELRFWQEFGPIMGIAILCYATSQVCSLAIRSGLVALAGAAMASLQVVGWAVLMWQLGVSLWVSVVPLPVFLLWATWLRSPDWMLERSSLRSRVQGLVSLLLPLGLIFASAAAYGAFEYPAIDPGFSLAEFTRPASAGERATAEQYRRAWRTISPPPFLPQVRVERTRSGGVRGDLADMENPQTDFRRWIDTNHGAVDAATRRDQLRQPCLLHDPSLPETSTS